MAIRLLIVCSILWGPARWALGQATAAGGDAAPVYWEAGKILRGDDAKQVMDPASSNDSFKDYPPLPDNWLRMEKQDYDLHAQVRELFHKAGMMDRANWPVGNGKWPDGTNYLNDCRNLANEIGDAAQYQSLVLIDQPDAFQSAGDLLKLADFLKNQPGENFVDLLVADGIRAMCSYRLMIIVANAKITEDEHDLNDLPLKTATDWIALLMDHPDAQSELDQVVKSERGRGAPESSKITLNRILELTRRVEVQRDVAAMSLAAHVYQYKYGRWPANLEELKTELPRVAVDPWGDGKETVGYVLVKGGLPDGSDRPLVYFRLWMTDGLFYRVDEPEYGIYNSDGSNRSLKEQKHGGQFLDVTSWVGREGGVGPTTRGLE